MKNKGKIMIIVIAAIISVLDLVILMNSAIYYYNIDMIDVAKSFIISGLIRICIYLVGFYLIYRRKKWARIVVEVLFVLRVLSGVLSLLIEPSLIYTISTGVFFASAILLFSKSINLYMNNNYIGSEEKIEI